MQVDDVEVTALGANLHRATAVVSNHGYLPTNLSDVAIENKVAKTVSVQIDCENAELVMNPRACDLGHLAGRNERRFEWSPWGQQWSEVTKKVEWLVKATGTTPNVTVTAASEKGGVHRQSVALG